MPMIDVVMPKMGESIMEGTITKWYKKVGDAISRDETLLEISTDKVDSEIPSPAAGIIQELLFAEQQTIPVHTVIARINSSDSTAVLPTEPVGKKPAATPVEIIRPAAIVRENNLHSNRFYSPLVLKIAQEEGIGMAELESIPGTGAQGRVSKNDILDYAARKKDRRTSEVARSKTSGVKDEIIPMDAMRRKIAEHMVRSVHTSAHVSSVTEADVTSMVAYRERMKGDFERREGFKLTYTPFFMDAVAKALNDYPLLNSSIEGDSIVMHKDINLGIAVALENGLIVPVVRNADTKNVFELAKDLHELSNRARTKKLLPEDVQGGTFTITNPGIFRNLYGTPIINQPQVAILGIGAIKKRPVVINDAIAIRSMVYISMSYDHRIIDGMLGSKFLQRVTEYLEQIHS